MSIAKLKLKYRFQDKFLNIVLEDYKDKINYMIDNLVDDDDDGIDTSLYVPVTTSVATTTPLEGGGTLASSRTISISGLSWAGTNNYLVGVQDRAVDGWEYKQLLGTSNQITVTHASVTDAANPYGTITLATPQDIATTSSPTFVDMTLSGNLKFSATSGDEDIEWEQQYLYLQSNKTGSVTGVVIYGAEDQSCSYDLYADAQGASPGYSPNIAFEADYANSRVKCVSDSPISIQPI
jgi:hypothetical protein